MQRQIIFSAIIAFASICGISGAIAQTGPAPTAPIIFFANLSPDEETYPTYGDAKGHADFSLDRDTLKLSWKVTYTGLSSPPTGAHIFGPQRPGANSTPVFDLAPKGLKSPLEGSVILKEGDLQNLLAGRYYVNIMTTKYEHGELRGQLDRLDNTEETLQENRKK
jgi:hypothetical protein